jgi:acyl transferase domain-containing protein
VEAHGTATPLGDPIEIEALARAFAATTARRRFCLIGSLKSNIGHLTAAAGAAGVIKTVLAMEKRWIPATLHFSAANPQIDFEATPFVVARAGVPWSSEGAPRRAGVSSFGAGGTNVHVVLEEAPERTRPEPARGPHLLPLSARTDGSLRTQAARLADAVERHADEPLGEVAANLQEGRRAFPRRSFVVAAQPGDAASALRRIAQGAPLAGPLDDPRPILLFPGQGSQSPGMAAGLIEALPPVRRRLEECAGHLGPLAGHGLLDWIAGPADAELEAGLQHTEVAQPALFSVQWALGATLLGPELSLAAVNAPRSCVVGGRGDAVRALEERLTALDLPHRRLRTSHAFHTPLMDDAARGLGAFMRGAPLAAPDLPFAAGPEGRLITAAEATDPAYWARQLRAPVRFADALASVASDAPAFMLEVGPRATLSALARQTLGARVRTASAMDREGDARQPDAVLEALGRLWAAGYEGLDWAALAGRTGWRRLSLPGYAFERRRCWIDAPAGARAEPHPPAARGTPTSAGEPTPSADIGALLEGQRRLIRAQLALLGRLADPRNPSSSSSST